MPQARSVSGRWTYRSFHNRSHLVLGHDEDALKLDVAEAVFDVAISDDPEVTGKLDRAGGELDMTGELNHPTDDP